MNDHRDWHQITCEEANAIRRPGGAIDTSLRCFSSLTDPSGTYGTPIVYTEWGRYDPDVAILREYRFPNKFNDYTMADAKPCEHWVPDAGQESREDEDES